LAQGRSSATVIVPDWTRSIPLPEILPAILDRLRRGGIESAATTIVIACGTHPKQDASELAPLVGDLPKGVAVVQHDAREAGGLVPAGELRPGVELRLARPAMDCELLVTVGGVRHHYFAGFGGGPKMVFPGVGGYAEIQANHSLVLQRAGGELVRDRRCEPGLLDGNRAWQCAPSPVERAEWRGSGRARGGPPSKLPLKGSVSGTSCRPARTLI
jgi:nickel-dependent lactate racemase